MVARDVKKNRSPRRRNEPVLFVGDLGNENLKGVSLDEDIVMPHALIDLSIESYDMMDDAGMPNPEVYKVNGRPYAIGNFARRKGAGAVKLGSDRYTEDYYGVLASILLFNAFPEGQSKVFFFGSHAPRDYAFREDLMNAVEITWEVEGMGKAKVFTVTEAFAFGEPEGGYLHATLGADGVTARNTEKLRKGETLIVDLGGLTTSIEAADSGVIDYTSAISHERGIRDVIEDFEKLLKLYHPKEMKGWTPRPNVVREGLRTGKLKRGGGAEINCKQAADEACNPLVSDVLRYMDTFASGIENFSAILLTGGGAGLLEARIRRALPDYDSIYVAEEDRTQIHMANAWGGMKRAKLLQAKGVL